jgi:hypothetical protein
MYWAAQQVSNERRQELKDASSLESLADGLSQLVAKDIELITKAKELAATKQAAPSLEGEKR